MNWAQVKEKFPMPSGIGAVIALVVIVLGVLIALEVLALGPVLVGCLFVALGAARIT